MYSTNIFSSSNNYSIIIQIIPLLLSSGVIYIFINLADNLITTNIKLFLIFIKQSNTPGNLAFNRMFNKKFKDNRLSRKKLISFYKSDWKKIKKHSKDSMYENTVWYKVYNKVKNESLVFYSNRNYLLMRDVNIISLMLLINYFFIKIYPNTLYNYKLHIYFFVIWIVTLLATHNAGKKFANNVLIANCRKKE